MIEEEIEAMKSISSQESSKYKVPKDMKFHLPKDLLGDQESSPYLSLGKQAGQASSSQANYTLTG